ncbi:peptidylprolyl isomerase [Undibacterium fentianense]|nr:peptidylprolyl isomerase [Undibacterium fentianense]
MSQLKVIMQTNKGTINLNLFAEQTPITCASFVNLIQHGYYDGLNFHRVISDFMIQGGCPDGTGMGGPGYRFKDECTSELRHDRAGILSMANAGPGTNGSQFFITHGPTPHLNGKHTVFGLVASAEDQKVVNSIARGDVMEKVTIEGDTTALLSSQAELVAKWNEILESRK